MSCIFLIKELVIDYYDLDNGCYIDDYAELIPIKDKQLYISRRSLKHFVERRKVDFVKLGKERSLRRMFFIIDHIEDAFVRYHQMEVGIDKFIYIKHYLKFEGVYLRIVVEIREGIFEIKSMHFRK